MENTKITIFGANNLTEGVYNLKSIPSRVLKNNDICIIYDKENRIYFYRLDEESGENENVPFIIKPKILKMDISSTVNTKRWKLISNFLVPDQNIVLPSGKYIQTEKIKAVDGENLVFESENEDRIIIQTNGKIIIDSQVSGSDPINENDFITINWLKEFVKQSRVIKGTKCVKFATEWISYGDWFYCDINFHECFGYTAPTEPFPPPGEPIEPFPPPEEPIEPS